MGPMQQGRRRRCDARGRRRGVASRTRLEMRSSLVLLVGSCAMAFACAATLGAQELAAVHALRSEPGARRISQHWFGLRGMRVDADVRSDAEAERMARGVLRAMPARLEIDVSRLRAVHTVRDATGGFAIFEQQALVGDLSVPVISTEVKVVWDRQGKVRAVMEHAWRGLEEPLAAARLTAADARRAVAEAQDVRLVVFVDEAEVAHAAWELRIGGGDARRVFVDAHDAALLGERSDVAHATGRGAFYWQNVIATPTLTNGAVYYLDGSGYLQGPYARVDFVNGGSATTRPFSPTQNFVYSPTGLEGAWFAQVMVYQAAVWAKVLLETQRISAVAPRGFQAFASFFGSSYEFSTRRIYVGSAITPDTDIANHEIGHAIAHDAGLVPAFANSDSDAIHEGLADFLSLIVQSNVPPATRPGRNWDLSENSAGGFLRTLDSCYTRNHNYIPLQIYNNGIILGAALRDLTLRTGRSTALRLAVQSCRYLNPASSFDDAVEALVLADQDLYQGVHTTLLRRLFWIRELSGNVPTNPWLPPAILESPHPYADDVDQTWTHTIPGASALIVTMHPATRTYRTSASPVDLLYVQDGNQQDIPGSPFSGELRGRSLRVPGDTVRIRLWSQPGNSRVAFGFRCERIVAENPANQAPRAVLNASATGGAVPFLVTFDARSSSDPDGSVMLYALDPGDSSDVVYLDPAHPVAEHFYNQALFAGSQTHPATLTVFDEHGASDSIVLPIVAVPHVPRAVYADFGDGCAGSLGVPTLTPSGSLGLGATLNLQLDNLPQHAAVLLTGFSNSTSPLGALPIELGPIGAAGCWLRVSPDVATPLGGAAHRASYSLNVPNLAALDGVAIYHQALVPDPNAGNTLGAVLSDAAGGLVGM